MEHPTWYRCMFWLFKQSSVSEADCACLRLHAPRLEGPGSTHMVGTAIQAVDPSTVSKLLGSKHAAR